MIYILAIRQLVPGKTAEYRDIETKQLMPFFNKSGIKMIGHWSTIIGNSNETVNIYAYNDLTHYQKVREAALKDPEYQKLSAALNSISVSSNSRLLQPSEWSPLK